MSAARNVQIAWALASAGRVFRNITDVVTMKPPFGLASSEPAAGTVPDGAANGTGCAATALADARSTAVSAVTALRVAAGWATMETPGRSPV
ncbi:hypothetical protein GCM10007973_02650 [Polymorphobacter multimanifer]|nr:hypothetical protein GCM10007973_02650 [Polymorphobacter multimanifer]